jgi:hypothetical protein
MAQFLHKRKIPRALTKPSWFSCPSLVESFQPYPMSLAEVPRLQLTFHPLTWSSPCSPIIPMQLIQLCNYATICNNATYATYATICNYMQLYATICNYIATIYMQQYATICNYMQLYATMQLCNLCNLCNFMQLYATYATLCNIVPFMQLYATREWDAIWEYCTLEITKSCIYNVRYS